MTHLTHAKPWRCPPVRSLLAALALGLGCASGDIVLPQDANILQSPRPPITNPELPATPGQFGSVSTTAGAGRATNGTSTLRAAFGRAFVASAPDFLFADEITPPRVDADGAPISAAVSLAYWRPEPIRPGEAVKVAGTDQTPVLAGTIERYYYSPHRDAIFASQDGVTTVVWRTRLPVDAVNNFKIKTVAYTVSPSTRRPVRGIFWTEGRYTGPKVAIPLGIIQDIKVAYNSNLPATVPANEAVIPPPVAGAPVLDKTLWFDEGQGVLRAINREGRVLVEYLGAITGAPGSGVREHLGVEVVQVTQETAPVEVATFLGNQILPKSDGITTDPKEASLIPSQVNAVNLGFQFVQRHTLQGRDIYIALRENPEPLRVQFYWMDKGLKDIRWPTYLNSYRLVWPENIGDFHARFVRPANSFLSDATFAAMPRGNTPELIFQDDEDLQETTLDFQQRLLVDLTGGHDEVSRSLLRFTAGNQFWYVRVHASTDELLGDRDGTPGIDLTGDAQVGQRIAPPGFADSVAGYIDTTRGTAYNVGAYIDPFSQGIPAAETGAIIPVNALPGNDKLRVWWFQKLSPPPGLGSVFQPIYFPSFVGEYRLRYPSNAPAIVMASNIGSDDLPPEQIRGRIYTQNSPNQHGYNPNEEHAILLAGRAYALRDDLNIHNRSSDPFVLIDFEGTDGRPAMAIFAVKREDERFTFSYSAVAGTLLQAPSPLPFLPLPLLANGQSKNEEVLSNAADPPENATILTSQPHYERFTYEDRKGSKWIYRGPHKQVGATQPSIGMKFYYKTQEGFAFPDANDGHNAAPALGTIVPFLRPSDGAGGFLGHPITGAPLTVDYIPRWPDQVPELRFGETLTMPKFGLPQIRGSRSLQVIYQESLSLSSNRASAKLHDPTRRKTYLMSTDSGQLDRIPFSIATEDSRGKTYFPNLPTHLQDRVFVDPLLGQKGALVFQGKFIAAAAGEDYLLLNVLSPEDLQTLKDLCDAQDQRKLAWDTAVAALSTKVERFVENPEVRGTYIVDPSGQHQTFTATQLAELTSPPPKPVVPANVPDGFYDEAVDSYALTAVGGGAGFVTVLSGNGRAFTPEEEPVQVHILRVGGGLYTGELKPIVSANPLSENVTVQHTGDFAAEPEKYDFEWRKAPPSDGLPPRVYNTRHFQVSTAATSFAVRREAILQEDGTIVWGNPSGSITMPSSLAVRTVLGEETFPVLSLFGSVNFQGLLNQNEQLAYVYLGLSAGPNDGFTVSVNGEQILAYNVNGVSTSAAQALPMDIGTFMGGVDVVFAVDSGKFNLGGQNQIEIIYWSTAAPNTLSNLDFRLGVTAREDLSGANYSPVTAAPEPGKNRHLVAGAGIDVLGDNYFVMRYRPGPGHSLYPAGGFTATQGWSTWTAPALVEGWIKRVLAGINPFNQRLSDFFENAIDTNTSLLSQAGERWEGDIALNLDNVQDAGLIEIYETVLKRGINLSINGTPPVNYAPANDALLLAAGYLADLYTALGDEAYADAANPTILFDANTVNSIAQPTVATNFESIFRSTATARFAFQGQVASLLDEELTLLRGRDDALSPGVRVRPAYNRFFWNYTRGINAGEVIYALNYNISEKSDTNADGKIDAVDAQRLFPQGHGDAYGHYLTALKNYYRLLVNPQFTWGTRSETVNVLGQAVSVDYLDERKFTAAAAALARTSEQIQSLEHRKAFQKKAAAGWSHFQPTGQTGPSGLPRNWSFDDWSARGGQGAYFHWLVANAILPHEDTAHEGIQKIDRSTVPELDELARFAGQIQTRFDGADFGLNPLGLTDDSVVFDISPSELANGKTHFEQIYDRAVRALGNAFDVFQRAVDSSTLLRSLENQDQNLNNAVVDQERAFTGRLVAIYGTPYAGDIGPGKTYPQDYAGPDLYRYMYIDRPFEVFNKQTLFSFQNQTRRVQLLVADPELIASLADPGYTSNLVADAQASAQVSYDLRETDGPYQIAAASSGKRAQIGSLQETLAGARLAEEQFYAGMVSMDVARKTFLLELENFEDELNNRGSIILAQRTLAISKSIYDEVSAAVKALREAFNKQERTLQEITDAATESLPTVAGLANDVSAAARAAILASSVSSQSVVSAADISAARVEAVANAVFLAAQKTTDGVVFGFEEDNFFRAQAFELRAKYGTARSAMRDVDASHIAYVRALERYRTEQAKGLTVLAERESFRKRAAAIVQGYRTRDVAFRTFRTEALEQYDTLFEQASRYAYLAAKAYDYESSLLDSEAGRRFLGDIIGSRALGLLDANGLPTFAASDTGDAGISGLLSKLNSDWSVAKGRLGFNNPDRYGTTFSLRREFFRIPENADGTRQWKELLATLVAPNLLADAEIATYALQIDTQGGTPVAGIVIPFQTSIAAGQNFFGLPLAVGDHRFTESNFATKVRSVGVVFTGYKGMETATSSHADALSATPHVYLLPVGADIIHTPPVRGLQTVREWRVLDHALPLPFDIGGITGNQLDWTSLNSLDDGFLSARKHQAFRAVNTQDFFLSPRSDEYTNSRLVGRSAANSRWKLVIPAGDLLNDPEDGLRRFINSVTDIQVHFQTYSHAGN